MTRENRSVRNAIHRNVRYFENRRPSEQTPNVNSVNRRQMARVSAIRKPKEDTYKSRPTTCRLREAIRPGTITKYGRPRRYFPRNSVYRWTGSGGPLEKRRPGIVDKNATGTFGFRRYYRPRLRAVAQTTCVPLYRRGNHRARSRFKTSRENDSSTQST